MIPSKVMETRIPIRYIAYVIGINTNIAHIQKYYTSNFPSDFAKEIYPNLGRHICSGR